MASGKHGLGDRGSEPALSRVEPATTAGGPSVRARLQAQGWCPGSGWGCRWTAAVVGRSRRASGRPAIGWP